MKSILIILLFYNLGIGQGFYTTFSGTENPLSESGIWKQQATSWTKLQKIDGVCYGTQSDDTFDDSYGYLEGYGNDYTIWGVIEKKDVEELCAPEVELHVRVTDSADSCQLYEILLTHYGTIQVFRWNGDFADFSTQLADANVGGTATGDTFKVSISNDTLKVYYKGALEITHTGVTYATGNPGIGMFKRPCANNDDFGFSAFGIEWSSESPEEEEEESVSTGTIGPGSGKITTGTGVMK